jgi:serine/threonine protein kinase
MFAIKILNRKVLKTKQISEGKSAYDFVLGELKILQTLQHPNVLWLHEIIDSPKKDHLYVVTEYHTNGSI